MTSAEAIMRLGRVGYYFMYDSAVQTEGRVITGHMLVHSQGGIRTVFIANTQVHGDDEVLDWVRRQVEFVEGNEKVLEVLEFCP